MKVLTGNELERRGGEWDRKMTAMLLAPQLSYTGGTETSGQRPWSGLGLRQLRSGLVGLGDLPSMPVAHPGTSIRALAPVAPVTFHGRPHCLVVCVRVTGVKRSGMRVRKCLPASSHVSSSLRRSLRCPVIRSRGCKIIRGFMFCKMLHVFDAAVYS